MREKNITHQIKFDPLPSHSELQVFDSNLFSVLYCCSMCRNCDTELLFMDIFKSIINDLVRLIRLIDINQHATLQNIKLSKLQLKFPGQGSSSGSLIITG